MQLTSSHFLSLGIAFICLGPALSKSNTRGQPLRRSITDPDSAEKRASLLGTLDDDEEGPTPKPPKTSKKSSNRHIKLPDDYDKLIIPSLGNVDMRVVATGLGINITEFEELGIDLNDIDLGLGSKADENLSIWVQAQVRSVRDIDEINEEITIELDFILKWVDYIILFGNPDIFKNWGGIMDGIEERFKTLDPIFLQSIWKPDLFIENLVSITRPELVTKPIRLLISPEGIIILSTRVSTTMDCEMEFHYYPADTQACVFRIRSYSHAKKALAISWGFPGPFLQDISDHNFDVKLDKLPSEELKGSDGLYDSNYTETFEVLQFKISARRKLSYHLIQTYLPSAFLIFITWLSFLVPATMVETRIGISMTILLTLTAMFASVRETAPTVSYVKAIDTWMVACIFFVFLTLLEFTLRTWRRHMKPTVLPVYEDEETVDTTAKIKNMSSLTEIIVSKGETVEVDRLSQAGRGQSKADFLLKGLSDIDLERFGFIIFSVLFIIFNLLYWSYLLIASKYFNWETDPSYNNMDGT